MRTPTRPRRAVLLTAALSVVPAGARADDVAAHGMPAIRVFHRDEGVPQSTVSAIAVEPGGRLWIGTQGGPAYYDGRRFTKLPLPVTAAGSIMSSIAVGGDGAVWFGTEGGGVFRYAHDRFTTYTEASGLPQGDVTALVEATVAGTTSMWVGTDHGIARLSGDRFVTVEIGPSKAVYALGPGELPGGAPGLWVGTGAGLVRCDAGGCAPFGDGPDSPSGEWVSALLEAPDDGAGRALWVGTKKGLRRFAGGRWETYRQGSSPLPHDYVDALAQTVSGSGRRSLWIGTYGGGLARLRGGGWTTIDPGHSTLPTGYVTALLPSSGAHGARTLWIGTDGGGVARLRHDGWVGFTAKNAPLDASGYVEAVGESALPDGTPSIWLAPNHGLLRWSGDAWTEVDVAGVGWSSSFQSCFGRSQRDPAAIWIGSSGGVGRWADGRLELSSPPLPPELRSLAHVIRESADGRELWVAAKTGAGHLEGGAWKVYGVDGKPLPGTQLFALTETARAGGGTTTWFGTNRGLARLDDGKWRVYDFTTAALGSNEINALTELRDAAGARVLWIGTMGAGVARYDLDAEAWRERLDDKSHPPLPDDSVLQARADARGRVYLFTHRGVTRLTPRGRAGAEGGEEFTAYTFTTEDGLPADEVGGPGALVDSRGRIWAGTVAGAAVFDPAEEVEDHTPKPFAALNARAGDRALGPGDAIRWDESSVTFEYGLLSFFRERDTRYRTRLVGFDPAPGPWSDDGKARYTNLPPGEYTFQVWGRDYAGNVSGPAEIAFRVRSAPWKTWWAALGYALCALGLVYGAFRARISALAEQNRRLEARVRERTQELDHKNEELGQKNAALGANIADLAAARTETERQNAELDRRVAELGRKNQELEASHRRADRIFSALADVLPGTELDGKYRLEARIGQGGFGAVFRARHLALGRDVAVKIFRPTVGNDSAQALARFRREGRSASLVSHPNAVQVFDAGVSREGIAYLVMELLEGRSLAEELHASGTLPFPRAAAITAQICAVLEAAHAHGILHRDIKPENVFLHRSPDGEVVKVVDFGIAKLVGFEDTSSDLRETQGIVGTPAYMAPERFKGDPYDARSDVYAVGVTAFEMLSGTLPYPPGERSLLEQMMRQIADPPVELSQVAPHVPADVARVVMECLSRDPAGRPTLRALAEVLEPPASSLPAPAHSLPPSSAMPHPTRSPPVDALGRTVDTFPATLAAATTVPDPENGPPGSFAETLEAPSPPKE